MEQQLLFLLDASSYLHGFYEKYPKDGNDYDEKDYSEGSQKRLWEDCSDRRVGLPTSGGCDGCYDHRVLSNNIAPFA